MSLMNTENREPSLRSQQATACREKINQAVRGANVAFYDMAMGLMEAYENEYAKEWGFENFSDYVQRELDMKYRQAYYFVEIGQTVRQLGIDADRVQKIGWTKMKEITGSMKEHPEDKEKYLGMAESMTTRELIEAVKSEVQITDAKDARPVTMRLSLKFEGDTASMISDGLTLSFGDIGREDVNQGLAYIVGEWMMARGGGAQASTLEQWIAFIEKTFGVKLAKVKEEENIDTILVENLAPKDEEVSLADDDALDELLR